MSGADPRPALWQAMVGRAEALHDLVVFTQRRPNIIAAARVARIAAEIATLANAAALTARGK